MGCFVVWVWLLFVSIAGLLCLVVSFGLVVLV